ncbi:MAG: NAD-binding protein [Gemmatimonadota bacterium]
MKTIGTHLATFAARTSGMRRRVAPFSRFLALLVASILLYGWLFHVIMGWEGQEHTWFTGIYWALTVMSTLGFGDITFHSDLGRAFSTLVLLTGIVLLLVILPFLFISSIYAPWLEERARARVRSMRRVPEGVEDHVLVCANDPLALGLIRRLKLAGIRAFLIEPDAEDAMALADRGIPAVTGNIDSIETYRAMRADKARLVVANASDTVNSNIILTVRALTESVPIVALAESLDSVDVLELSGATHVLTLKQRLGEQLANRVSGGSAHANIIGSLQDLKLAEFPVHNTPFQGSTIRDTGLGTYTGVSIVGVWRRGQLHQVDPDFRLTPQCVPVVLGTAEQLEALDEVLVIYDANPNPVLVIGGGKVGRSASRAIKNRGMSVNVVERNEELEPRIAGIPDRVIIGDAADRHVLEGAGIRDTPCVLLTTHDDAMNVYLTVYCRRLNPDARILTRATHRRNVEAIQRAGADFVLSYADIGVQTTFSIARGRDISVLGEGLSMHSVPVPASLVGATLGEADIVAKTGLSVIAIEAKGNLAASPGAKHVLKSDTELIALGDADQRERFNQVFG